MSKVKEEYKPVEIGQKLKLVYDIKSIPTGLPPNDLVKLFNNHDLVLWDSSNEGIKPALYGVDGKCPLMVVDTAGSEVDLNHYTNVIREEEYWDRELYNCKNSPIYFFSNYGTPVWPHTDKDLKAYLKTIKIKELVAKDDEDAKKLWDAQKEQMKLAMADTTIEFLKERKGVLEILKKEYEDKIKAMEYLISPFVEFKDKEGKPLEAKAKAIAVVNKLKRMMPVPVEYAKYKTKKGYWDASMLHVTEYGILISMYYGILQNAGKIKVNLDSPAEYSGTISVDATSGNSVAESQSE